jgi:hypothetical protein
MAVLGRAGSPDPITFHCPQGSCQARAQIMVEHLQQMALSPLKAWAMSDAMALQQPLAGYPVGALTSVNEQGTPLINELGTPTVWSFHVAPAVEVETPAGTRPLLVIDPSLARRPISLGEWHGRVGTPDGLHTRQLTSPGQSPIDPFTGEPFRGTGYWPKRTGDPADGPSQHARQTMQRLLADHALPAL